MKRNAHYWVDGVNLGDGEKVSGWLKVGPAGIEFRKFRARRTWWLPLEVAVERIAIEAQRRAVAGRM